MKQLYLIFASSLFIACSQNLKEASQNQMLSLTFELDTVMVDAGEDFISLQNWLQISDLSIDRDLLYNYNNTENRIEVISLEELKLTEKIYFDKEGPNGTGRVMGFHNINDHTFFIKGLFSVEVFSKEAKRLSQFKFTALKAGILEDKDNFYNLDDGVFNSEKSTYFGFYNNGKDIFKGLAILDLQKGSLKKVPIPELEELDKFRVKFETGGVSFGAIHFLSYHKGKILVSNSAKNELLIYDLNGDRTSHISFTSHITPNAQQEVKMKNYDSQEAYDKAYKENDWEIKFGHWVWDPKSESFYRLSKQLFSVSENEKEYKTVLTIFDKNFIQLYEGIIPLKKSYHKMFFRKGKLYLFENINDELAFIVLTLKEN
jgi:hypothetical protein